MMMKPESNGGLEKVILLGILICFILMGYRASALIVSLIYP